MYTSVCMYMHACMHARTNACMYVCVYVCMYAAMHVCVYVYIYMFAHIYIYADVNTQHMYICMCRYTHHSYRGWAAEVGLSRPAARALFYIPLVTGHALHDPGRRFALLQQALS